ncbi:hypothetical protein N658DRAFT_122408 [Parathielavia hyrcaniae]|uniref:Uncharacterized protein n=1 Tax=Parathielavia hyrcaniae TaxID=113614 RepID=A0AAN6Q8H2_9PEZI|nr:hypothetical protein N658DRAFT_122408 [Parathielavia hyrcaniae]
MAVLMPDWQSIVIPNTHGLAFRLRKASKLLDVPNRCTQDSPGELSPMSIHAQQLRSGGTRRQESLLQCVSPARQQHLSGYRSSNWKSRSSQPPPCMHAIRIRAESGYLVARKFCSSAPVCGSQSAGSHTWVEFDTHTGLGEPSRISPRGYARR